jgi:hypothetical protein
MGPAQKAAMSDDRLGDVSGPVATITGALVLQAGICGISRRST